MHGCMQGGVIDYGNDNQHIAKKGHKVHEEKGNEENSLQFRLLGEAQNHKLSYDAVIHPALMTDIAESEQLGIKRIWVLLLEDVYVCVYEFSDLCVDVIQLCSKNSLLMEFSLPGSIF